MSVASKAGTLPRVRGERLATPARSWADLKLSQFGKFEGMKRRRREENMGLYNYLRMEFRTCICFLSVPIQVSSELLSTIRHIPLGDGDGGLQQCHRQDT